MRTKLQGIGTVSRQTGISPTTLTRYRKEGLIQPDLHDGGRYFYSDSQVKRIQIIYEKNLK